MARKLITAIVDNGHLTLLLILIVLFYGFTSLSEINVAQDPDIDYPVFALELYLPGSTPARMEQVAVYPIERELRQLAGITQVRTNVFNDYAIINVRFDYEFDTQSKMQEAETLINQIKRKLPADLEFKIENMVTSSLLSAFVVAIEAPHLDREGRRDQAEDLVETLRQVPFLKDVELLRPTRELVVELDTFKLKQQGLSVSAIAAEIQSFNQNSVGALLPRGEANLRYSGPDRFYKSTEDVESTLVFTDAGEAIRLREVASVYLRNEANRGTISRLNGQPVELIKIGVESQKSNILEVKDDVTQAIRLFEQQFETPPKVTIVFDQAREVSFLLSGLVKSFFQGVAIVFLVLLFAVGMRSTVIITSLLPLSFLMAVMLLSFTDFGIQQVSLAGFIIALGLMVDNAIVVTENSYILQNYEQMDRREAAITGTSSALSPLLSSMLTTMLAFAPVFMLTADTALYLRSLSVSIWLSLIASLFIAVTFVALLLSRMGTLGTLFNLPQPPSFLNALIPFRDTVYEKILRFTVRWRYVTILAFTLLLVFSLTLASKLKVEVFPPTGNPYFTINVDLPIDLRDEKRNEIISNIEAVLGEYNEIVNVSLSSGVSYPWLNVSMDPVGDVVFLVETTYGEEARLTALINSIQKKLVPLSIEAEINLSLFKYKDPVYRSPFTVVIEGKNAEDVLSVARELHEPLNLTPGVSSVSNPAKSHQASFQLNFDYETAAMLGVRKSQIDPYFLMMTYGYEIDRFRTDQGDDFPILLRVGSSSDIEMMLRQILIPAANQRLVPLSDVVEIEIYESELSRQHVDFVPTTEIEVWLEPGTDAGELAEQVDQLLQSRLFPSDVKARIGGALAQQQQDYAGFGKNALIIAALIFSIFVMQFRSLLQPLVVFTAVPFCLIGVIAALLIADLPMTFFAAVGITSLMGIVVNDSILLVDEANKLKVESPEESITDLAIEAARKRFMPIVLTSVTTIAGLIPLALEDSPFRVMAVCIIGGLVSSTLLLLFLVPALYSMVSFDSNKGVKS